MKYNLLLLLSIFSLITLASAGPYSTNVIQDSGNPYSANINKVFGTGSSNASLSNSSDYWDDLDTYNSTQFSNNGGTLTILESYLTSLGNSIWCSLTGCTMAGDINMGGNDITNAGTITATDFVGDGSGLTNLPGEGLNNSFNMYFTSSMKKIVIWNFSKSDETVVNMTIEPGDHYIFGGEVV